MRGVPLLAPAFWRQGQPQVMSRPLRCRLMVLLLHVDVWTNPLGTAFSGASSSVRWTFQAHSLIPLHLGLSAITGPCTLLGPRDPILIISLVPSYTPSTPAVVTSGS